MQSVQTYCHVRINSEHSKEHKHTATCVSVQSTEHHTEREQHCVWITSEHESALHSSTAGTCRYACSSIAAAVKRRFKLPSANQTSCSDCCRLSSANQTLNIAVTKCLGSAKNM